MYLFRIFLLTCFVLVAAGCDNAEGSKTQSKSLEKTATVKKKVMLFFGDSLTAGYGLDDPSMAFPALIQKRTDSLGLSYEVINAGVSGETSSGGLGRIDWILKQSVDVFILELGANDGLRGISPEETEKNLQGIIDRVRTSNPKAHIILAGMQVPPSMGKRYVNQFNEIFPRLAKKNNTDLIPFLLEGVGGEPELNQQDGIHPTAEGHQLVAENVWKTISKVVE